MGLDVDQSVVPEQQPRPRLSVLNEARQTLAGPAYLQELVASTSPENVAIDYLGVDGTREVLRYRQLKEYAQHLAHLIRQHGGSRAEQAIIPVLMPQCPELYISYLAILEAGAGFCPIQPDAPAERVKFVVRDVDADLVLTIAPHLYKLEQILPDVRCQLVSLTELRSTPSTGPARSREDSQRAIKHEEDIAYVMYTSGSTGLPKGVKIPHRSVVQSLLAHDEHIPPFKRFLQFASPTFDVSVFEIFFPLFRGGTLVCCERERMLADLPGTIRELNADAAELTPTVAGTLLRTRDAAPGLKTLLTIGEMLTRPVIEEFGGSASRVSMLYAMYGPTEAAIHCTLAPTLSTSSSSKNIGVPLSTVTAFILSDASESTEVQILPVGHVGELAVAGQLACGYLNRPKETAAAFIHLAGFGEVYRTGDKALVTAENVIHILGRISTGQVKLRGQRIELGEIEEIACKTPGLQLAVACVIKDSLTLFCTGTSNLAVEDIDSTCAAWLPRFMRPNEIVVVPDGLPRLPSGKVDRRKLETDFTTTQASPATDGGVVDDDVKSQIVNIVGRGLHANIRLGSSLWANGLDSLKAIKIASELRRHYPQTTMTMLLESETVDDLCARLNTNKFEPARLHLGAGLGSCPAWDDFKDRIQDDVSSEIFANQIETVLPCSLMQTALLTETSTQSWQNFNSISLQHPEHILPTDIRSALTLIAAENQILRSGFIPTKLSEFPFVRVVWPSLSFKSELSLLHPLQVEAGNDCHSTIVKIHHAIYDGWSWELVMSDINRILSGKQLHRRPQFHDFYRHAIHVNVMNYEVDQIYWADMMQDVQPHPFPNLRSKRGTESVRRSCFRHSIAKSTVIGQLCASLGISRQSVMLAAFTLLLGVYCDTSDVICGIVASGREQTFPGLDQVIGPCFSVYPLRIHLNSVQTMRDLLCYINQTVIGYLKHNSLSTSQIKQASRLPASRNLFDTLFIWQEGPDVSSGGSLLVKTSKTSDALNHALVLEAGREGEDVWAKIVFDDARIPAEHADLILQQIEGTMVSVAAEVTISLSDVWANIPDSALSKSRSEAHASIQVPNLKSVIESFARQDPNRIALEVVTDAHLAEPFRITQKLTYQELYTRSLGITRFLACSGPSKQDDWICIIIERSVDLYLVVLAVVLFGSGFLCIDPSAKDEEITEAVTDTRSRLVITSQPERLKRLLNDEIQVWAVPELKSNILTQSRQELRTAPGQSLFCAIYTSGVTGIPKMVTISHHSILSHVNQLVQTCPGGPSNGRLLQIAPQSSGMSISEIFWAWYAGMTLCAAACDVPPHDILTLLDNMSISHLILTPSVAEFIDPRNAPEIEILLITGDPMKPKVFDAWKDKGLYHAYGQSETTNICTIRARASSDDIMDNVGHVLGNSSIFVCARLTKASSAETQLSLQNFKPLPKGATGEIWIGGDQICHGYVKAESIPRSWLEHPKYGRLYKSADIGRMLADNSLVILGRDSGDAGFSATHADFREINSILLNQKQVKDAETLILDGSQTESLVSFVCLRPLWRNKDQGPTIQSIFQALRHHLRGYTIPQAIVPIERIPLTSDGKIDRAHLEAFYRHLGPTIKHLCLEDRENIFETSSLSLDEAKVMKILSEVLRTPPQNISRHTSFYKLGLDSLNGIALVQALKSAGFTQVDVSTVLKNASIARLTPLIQHRATDTFTPSQTVQEVFDSAWVKSIRSKYEECGLTVSKIMPCTSLQESMLSVESHIARAAYQNQLKWKLKADVEVIRSAWIEMMKRHDLLRTAFVQTNNVQQPFAQVVLESFELPWTETQCTNDNLHYESNINLPPYNLQVSRVSGSRHPTLTLNIHHAIYDADAMAALLQEIEDLICGRPLKKAQQFTAYIDYMLNMEVQKADSFWTNILRQCRPSRMQNLVSFSDTDSLRAEPAVEEVRSKLGLGVLEERVRNQSVRLLPVLQAALARLLSYYLQDDDVCFGNVSSGRNLPIPNVQYIIGPCFNTLPVRTRFTSRQGNRDVVDELNRQNLETAEHQPSSLRRIQKMMSPDGKMLFDVILLFQQPNKKLKKSIWTLEEDRGNMSFPYILEVIPSRTDDSLMFRLHHETCNQESALHFLGSFDILLNQIVDSPHALATDFSILESFGQISRQRMDPHGLGNPETHSSKHDLTTTEREVLSILREFFNPYFGEIDQFTTIFKLGLDSVDAVQIASRLRMKGYFIHGSDILESPTIQGIAKFCDEYTTASRHKPLDFSLHSFDSDHRHTIIEECLVDPNSIEKVLPCTPTQSGILSQFQNSRGVLYYNRTRLLLKRDINLHRLKKCWESVMMRHAMLRTGFWQLEHARYPFAMIVYKSEYANIVWTETHQQMHDFHHKGAEKLRRFHQLSWEIILQSHGGQKTMDIWMLHAIYDARSLQIILADVAMTYSNPNRILRPFPIDSAVIEILRSSHGDDQAKKFWTEMGSDLEPTKFPDLNIHRQASQRLAVCSISSGVTPSYVQDQCSRLEMSLQTICQAAWAKLLAAYCGQRKVTFGVILSGRTFEDEEMNGVAFPCINTIPFAVELTGDDRALLHNVSQRNAGLLRHQNIPLTTIKRLNGITGQLFDTVLVLQKFRGGNNVHDLWTVIEDEASGEYTASLEIIPRTDDYQFQLIYQPEIIPEQQASLILREFQMIWYNLLQEDVNHLQAEDVELLSVLPPKDTVIPTIINFLHELVEETVARQPDAIALEFVTKSVENEFLKQTWTYLELNNRGNQVANLLIQNRVEVGQIVAICFDKCPEASFAILGVLKAGCTYLALDPDAPEARKQFILKDANCEIVLTTKNRLTWFEASQVLILPIDDERVLSGVSFRKPALDHELTKEHACYCLYTSGTTGTPKGCLISHTSAVQAMLSFSRIFEGRWTSQARWLQFAAFHFDVSVLEQYWSWHVGICVTSMPRDLLFEDLAGMIHKLGITHLDLTPSLARLLSPVEVPNLREGVFIVGGEQVHQDILDVWGDVGCLFNFYGPSEVTIGCTVHPNVQQSVKPTNIGRQWDNVGSFVLRPGTVSPVIRGAIGELCLSGPLVGKGYLNRPDLTSEKFCLLQNYGVRIYRSGDLVRMLHDGSFDFLGRIDDQVKLRGQRLEIGEINHVIGGASKQIADVSTLVLKHHGVGKEHLVAFFSASARLGRKLKEPELLFDKTSRHLADLIRKHCTNHLPIYMVPTHFIGVDFIPLNANNKADHNKLRQIFQKASMGEIRSESGHDGPGTSRLPPNIDHLMRILAKYFDIDSSDINPDSSLFELGLDSISVIGLSRMLKREGFPHADIPTIMANSLLLDLAEAVDTEVSDEQADHDTEIIETEIKSFSQKHQKSISQDIGVPAHHIEAIVPCTPLQQGMVSKVAGAEKSQRVPYFCCFTYQLHPNTSVEKLENAWKQSARQLGILRTRFVATEDGCAQVILKKHKVSSLHLHGIVDAKDILDAFDDWVNRSKKFGRSLPWQICFTHADTGIIHMSVFLFHGLYDGTSLSLMLKTVEKNYSGCEHALQSQRQFHTILPYGPLSRPKGAEKFWQKALSQISLLNLSPCISKSSKTIRVLEEAKYPSLNQICSQLSVTTPAIFHAAWLYALFSRYRVNPTIGIVSSGRLIAFEGVEDIIGPMLNTIPCSIYTSRQNPGIYDLIHACHEFKVNCLPYQHTSVRNIAKWIKTEGRGELFDSLLVFQKKDTYERENPDLWTEISSNAEPDYPLNIEIIQTNDCGDINITVAAKECEILRKQDIRVLLNTLKLTVERICNGDDFQLPPNFDHASGLAVQRQQYKNEKIMEEVGRSFWEENVLMNKIRVEMARLADVDVEKVNTDSPTIFELGLDSIDALKLAARLKGNDIVISVNRILKNPTVSGIAELCKQQNTTRHHASRDMSLQIQQDQWRKSLQEQGVKLENGDQVFPVTPMQEGLLLDFERYYHVIPYKVRADTDAKLLTDALQHLSRTIPILRARFFEMEDPKIEETFVQVIQNEASTKIQRVRLRRKNGIKKILQQLRDDAVHLGLTGQFLQICVATVQEDGSTLMLLGLPHAMYDGWSLQLIHAAIQECYDGKFDEHGLQSFVTYLEESCRQAKDEQVALFWQNHLNCARPTLFHEPSLDVPRKATFLEQQSRTPRFAALELCKSIGITPQSLGLTCWALLLAHNTKTLDVLHGVVLSGRITEGADHLIFPTFNTAIFRTQLQLNVSGEQLLKQVHRSAYDVMDNQHYPLKSSLRLIKNSSSGVFNTLFTYQKDAISNEMPTALYDEYDLGSQTIHPPYPVNVEMSERDGQTWWTCAVQDNVASAAQVKGILDRLDEIMEFLLNSAETPVVVTEKCGTKICNLCPIQLKEEEDEAIDASKNLAAPSSSSSSVHYRSSTTWNTNELKVRTVLAQISNVDEAKIDKRTGIFHLGLDSVSAIKIAGQLRRSGLKISVSELVRAQTLDNIARLVTPLESSITKTNSHRSEVTSASLAERVLTDRKIPLAAIETILPAAAGQVYMLDAWRASGGRLFYADFWFQATEVSKETFEHAFKLLTTMIPTFRTSFLAIEGKVFAVTFKAKASHSVRFPWALETIEQGDRVLAKLHIHHALYDAVGLHIIVSSLTMLCQDFQARLQLYTDFQPFLRLTRDLTVDMAGHRQRFWTTYLGVVDAENKKHLTGSFSTSRKQKFVPNVLAFESLKPTLKKHGVSIQTLFFAAYACVHARLLTIARSSTFDNASSVPSHVILGIYIANRFLDVENIESLVGPTFNILPLKIKTASMTSSALIETARQIQRDIQVISRAEHSGVSLRDIYNWTGLKLDGYMNFLRLPDDQDNVEDERDAESELRAALIDGLAGDRRNGRSGQRLDGSNIKVTHAEGESLYDAQSTFRDEARETFETRDRKQHGDSGYVPNLSYAPSPYLLDNLEEPKTLKMNWDLRQARRINTKAVVQNEPDSSNVDPLTPVSGNENGVTYGMNFSMPYETKKFRTNISEVEIGSKTQANQHGYVIPAIDIEARVMPDKNLAIGVFAPSDIICCDKPNGDAGIDGNRDSDGVTNTGNNEESQVGVDWIITEVKSLLISVIDGQD